MKNTQPHSDPIKAYRRKAVAVRRVGSNDRCSCGEARPEALIGSSGACAACKRKAKGFAVTDKHHVAGSANSAVTVDVHVNDHRAVLSEAQYDWPKKTLENPDGCPLRAAAACIRGFINTLLYLCESTLKWIAEMVELLSEYLIERRGPRWWTGTPLEHFAKKGQRKCRRYHHCP